MSDSNAQTGRGLAAVLAAMVSVQVGAAVGKGLFPLVGPEGVAALRVGLSALVLAAVFRIWRLRADRQTWLALAAYGLTLGLMNLLIYQAFERIPIGVAVSIEVVGPLAVALASSRRLRDLAWVALASVGLILLPMTGAVQALDPVGVAYALAAGACWGGYIVFGSRLTRLGAGRTVAAGMMFAAVVAVPAGVIAQGAALLDWRVLATGLAVAALSSMAPYLLDMSALNRLPRRVFGVLVSASPAVAALAGLWILGEALAPLQWLGVALIVTACGGCAWTTRPIPPAPVQP